MPAIVLLLAGADTPERVVPALPEDGSVTGPRPVFSLRYEAAEEISLRETEFRITLEPIEEDGTSYEFDQRRRRNGWLLGDVSEVIYRAPRPLLDGNYRWRAWLWNGVEWSGGDGSFRLRIDSVAPAVVEGLTVRFDEEAGHVVLEWEPVSLDLSGRPEFVARYHVYRYERRGFPVGAKVNEVGVVQQPRFVDRELPGKPSRILFYKITAEDAAGNETERRN